MGLTSAQRYNRMLEQTFKTAREDLPSSLNNFYWRKGKVVKRKKGKNKRRLK